MFMFFRSVFFASLLMVLVHPAFAQSDAARYEDCMRSVMEQPLAAYETALAWEADSGGAPARHCVASALIELGDMERAAERLKDLGSAPDIRTDQLRAEIFGQSAEVFLQLAQYANALAAIDAALALVPDDFQLRIDRARALVELEEIEAAVQELDTVLASQPDDLLALRLRATGLIQLQQLALAELDVAQALSLAPSAVDVLLLRGALREAQRLAAKP